MKEFYGFLKGTVLANHNFLLYSNELTCGNGMQRVGQDLRHGNNVYCTGTGCNAWKQLTNKLGNGMDGVRNTYMQDMGMCLKV